MESPPIFEYIFLRKICIELKDEIFVLSVQKGDPSLKDHLKETHIKFHESARQLELEIGMGSSNLNLVPMTT